MINKDNVCIVFNYLDLRLNKMVISNHYTYLEKITKESLEKIVEDIEEEYNLDLVSIVNVIRLED